MPQPGERDRADVIYICSPNNPTGAVFSRERLKQWVDYANRTDAVLLFDAAYEAFIEDEDIPHSIFEIEGAKPVPLRSVPCRRQPDSQGPGWAIR